jgi:hypothetical protein
MAAAVYASFVRSGSHIGAIQCNAVLEVKRPRQLERRMGTEVILSGVGSW